MIAVLVLFSNENMYIVTDKVDVPLFLQPEKSPFCNFEKIPVTNLVFIFPSSLHLLLFPAIYVLNG